MTERTLQRDESGWSIKHTIPVTLREVEEAGVALDSQTGIDDDERAELLDDETILRVVRTLDFDQGEPSISCGVQVYQGTLQHPEPRWDWASGGQWKRCLALFDSLADRLGYRAAVEETEDQLISAFKDALEEKS